MDPKAEHAQFFEGLTFQDLFVFGPLCYLDYFKYMFKGYMLSCGQEQVSLSWHYIPVTVYPMAGSQLRFVLWLGAVLVTVYL